MNNLQIHPLKQAQGTTSIQAIGNTVTLAQVLPTRTQTIVYSGGTNANFVATPKLAVSSNIPSQRQIATTRPTVYNDTLTESSIKIIQFLIFRVK